MKENHMEKRRGDRQCFEKMPCPELIKARAPRSRSVVGRHASLPDRTCNKSENSDSQVGQGCSSVALRGASWRTGLTASVSVDVAFCRIE